MDCLFCRIVSGEIPADIVYQDQDVVAFRDIDPQAPQHVLIVPRRHIESIATLTSEDDPILASICASASRVASKLGIEKSGYRFLTNVGPDAGLAVFHLHFHLLGGRRFGWPPG